MLVAQSCPTLSDPIAGGSPGFSVHRILQARILEQVAISFSRRSSRPRMKSGSPAFQADSLPCIYKKKKYSEAYKYSIIFGKKKKKKGRRSSSPRLGKEGMGLGIEDEVKIRKMKIRGQSFMDWQ